MAKTIFDTGAKLKVSSIKAMKQIRSIEESLQYALSGELKEITLGAKKTAQDTLQKFRAEKSTSQQLSTKQAVDEVGVKYNKASNSAYVYAPINEENKNSMYFLEYGAGIHNTRGTSHTNGEPWIYPIDNGEKDIHKEITGGLAMSKLQGTAQHTLGDQAYKFRDWSYQSNQWFGITRTSKPVRYMDAARRYILWNARPKTIEAINLAIQNHSRRIVRNEEE